MQAHFLETAILKELKTEKQTKNRRWEERLGGGGLCPISSENNSIFGGAVNVKLQMAFPLVNITQVKAGPALHQENLR